MFYLHVANRTENLLAQLGALLQADSCDPFARELFLVQSQGMERVVSQSLAGQLGAFCNFRFFFPLELFHYTAERLGVGISPDGFDRNILTWRLDALLREVAEPVYQPLHHFLQGEEADRKRFQLARRLANCFDQYQLMRSGMVCGWETGVPATEHPSEVWQMALWQRLVAQEGGAIHRATLFLEILRILRQAEDGSLATVLPHRLSVFGIHTLPPLFLEYLRCLAKHLNVHFYLLSPCRHFWGDLQGRGSWLKRQLQKGQLAVEEDEFLEGHPLLASLGRQGRDLQNSMLEMDFTMEFPSYTDPAELAVAAGRQPTLLEVVQRDLLAGEVAPAALSLPDSSVRLVSCHSRLRELEVLRQHLLQLLEGDGELLLREIVVMAPDIQDYAPFIPAIFHDIGHSVADRSLQQRNPVFAAFLVFLHLFSGRFGRSEVLELLQYPMVAARFALSGAEVARLGEWTEEAGIRWGLSAEQRQELGVQGFAEGSFRAGLDRMLLGSILDYDDFVDGILPFTQIEGKETQALGGLCQYIELLEWAAARFRKRYSLDQWEGLLQECVDQLFEDDGSSELMELRSLLASLAEAERFTGDCNVDFSTIFEWIKGGSLESRSSSGFLRGQLTFCSMLPMRSIPFQVVCLLGLDDGVFPKSDRADTFDLLAVSHQPGDRSPRSDDRYQFLEALLAARHTLYLSYVGQSEKSGEPLPPSVVVSELLELLEKGYGVKELTVAHPLYPFSSRYFDGSTNGLFSCSEAALRIASAQQHLSPPVAVGEDEVFPWWKKGNLVGAVEETISLDDLVHFYKNPPAWFVRNILGISLQPDNAAEDDCEMFTPDPLTRYSVNDTLFHQLFPAGNSSDEENILRRFQHSGNWPLGATGVLSFQSCFAEIQALAARAEKLSLGLPLADRIFQFDGCAETAGFTLSGTIVNRYERGNLVVSYGPLRGHHLLSAWLFHLLENFQARLFRPTWLLSMDACGCFDSSSLQDNGDKAPDLAALLRLWQQGRSQPLPLYTEPAFAWARQTVAGKDNPLLEAAKAAERSVCQGYEPEWALLLAGRAVAETLTEGFLYYAREIVTPLYTMFVDSGGGR